MSFVSFVWKDGEKRETLIQNPNIRSRLCRTGDDTYHHIDNGSNGSQLGGPGVVRCGKVLPVVLVCGNEWQPGVLESHKTNEISSSHTWNVCLPLSRPHLRFSYSLSPSTQPVRADCCLSRVRVSLQLITISIDIKSSAYTGSVVSWDFWRESVCNWIDLQYRKMLRPPVTEQ